VSNANQSSPTKTVRERRLVMERKCIDLKIRLTTEVTITTFSDMEHSMEYFTKEINDHISVDGYYHPWCAVALENIKCTSIELI
jgi:hypothetical protein